MSLVFVTGISGFLGSHLVNELLIAGYRVRGTVRSEKMPLVEEGYADSPYKDRLEIVEVNDFVSEDVTELLKGVEFLIHSASLLFEGSPEEEIAIAEQGTLNFMRQAEKAGVRRMVLTSSISTTLNNAGQWTPETWCSIPKEAALSGKLDSFTVYMVSKTLAEHAIWTFADEHPHVDVSTINAHFFFGKFAPGFRIPKNDVSGLGPNGWLYQILRTDGRFPAFGGCADVVDAARAHVLALTAPPTSEVGRKRFLISTEWFHYKDVVEFIAEKRPELKYRLLDASKAQAGEISGKVVDDFGRCKSVLGLELRDWHDTVLDAVDALIELEKQWQK